MLSKCSMQLIVTIALYIVRKFVVFSCVLVFSFLFSLRLDNTIEWSYWVIFIPVWIWKFLVISGAIVGSYVWFTHPQYRFEGDSFVQFKAMIMTTSLHLMFLVFDILACDNLQTNSHPWLFVFIPLMFMSIVAIGFCVWAIKNERSFGSKVCDNLQTNSHPWLFVFIPLMFISIVAIGFCVWAIKNERSFGLELFCSVNILQFIFLALRLDNVIKWSWVTVFIPIWILMCISMIGVIYAIILAIVLSRSSDIMREQRRGNLTTAVGYSLLFVPMLIFEILLANRLDGENHFKYTAITVPLFISLLTLMALSFGAKGGNQWWFGIRKDFCTFLLGVCPCLQEYGNISYSIQTSDSTQENIAHAEKISPNKKQRGDDLPRLIMPVVSIEMPD